MIDTVLGFFHVSRPTRERIGDLIAKPRDRETPDWAAELVKSEGTVPERFFEFL